jgi:hypothetical protein
MVILWDALGVLVEELIGLEAGVGELEGTGEEACCSDLDILFNSDFNLVLS